MKKSLPILLSASLISGVVDAKPTMPQSAQKQIDAIQQAVDKVAYGLEPVENIQMEEIVVSGRSALTPAQRAEGKRQIAETVKAVESGLEAGLNPQMPEAAQKQIDAIQQAVDIVSSAQTKTGLSAVVQGASAPKAPKRKLTAKAKAKAVATIQSLKEILDPIVERAKR